MTRIREEEQCWFDIGKGILPVENTAATAPKSLRKRCLYDVAQLVTDAEKENAVCSERLYCFSKIILFLWLWFTLSLQAQMYLFKKSPHCSLLSPSRLLSQITGLDLPCSQVYFYQFIFYSVFCLVPCGRLSWLFVCFQAHIKCFIIVSCHVVWAGFGVTALGQPASLMTAAAAATPRANHDGGYVTFLVSVQSERQINYCSVLHLTDIEIDWKEHVDSPPSECWLVYCRLVRFQTCSQPSDNGAFSPFSGFENDGVPSGCLGDTSICIACQHTNVILIQRFCLSVHLSDCLSVTFRDQMKMV